ncbi:nitrate reductase molybdenum cofactor assembly chaperone [Nocardiopsis lambiniae]|uniref:Nitrate reductase molybdenum cofactor assembly chaperone n=1 Tax=Nocardiopsis lambiniae TaxID=3075539 RepID=A0ABU2M352_9ACTN|nr:nitrate reductase molybdenum cofactor assembly chaperone [Nocardiopsis sp. DSM 44743]MDT0327074.1 nitrate reductase molybdenum cofactor assembly chaperone [Nocardiopsis sp. DSM 44743]
MSTTTDRSGAEDAVPATDAGSTTGSIRTGWLDTSRSARRAHRGAVTHQVASVLLGYPDRVFFERLPLVARAVAELPRGAVHDALREFCVYASVTPEVDLCRHHVDVFDPRQGRSPYMTHHTDGDTRRRGRALAEIEALYRDAGWDVSAGEPPDHLAVVLEFAARGDARRGGALLSRLRPGLDLLAAGLEEYGTPYTLVVNAVRWSLPSRSADDGEAMRRPPEQGPPAEEVGLGPYGVRRTPPLVGGRDHGPEVPRPRAAGGPDAFGPAGTGGPDRDGNAR